MKIVRPNPPSPLPDLITKELLPFIITLPQGEVENIDGLTVNPASVS